MFALDGLFSTYTACPHSCGIFEIEPTAILKPYVRCFWKCEKHDYERALRVIPDCCTDIIIPLDGSPSVFVGASNSSFKTYSTGDIFCIRFYAWGVAPFLRFELSEFFNSSVAAREIFKDFDKFEKDIVSAQDTDMRVELAQRYLLSLLGSKMSADVLNGVYYAIRNECRATVGDLSDYCAVSKRTMERMFKQYIGMSPKSLIELIRYQLLWQDCLRGKFVAADSAFKLGYYDEAHMYNDFKKYHGIGLSEAVKEFVDLSHFYNTLSCDCGKIKLNNHKGDL